MQRGVAVIPANLFLMAMATTWNEDESDSRFTALLVALVMIVPCALVAQRVLGVQLCCARRQAGEAP